ncbi:putative bifunctional diguanylate cyclase/phosphodiesterase [Marinobacter sp. DUT-1]|uniref:putative bifunctional diguanylate cyclase/phosphodiesterase n=1 Tax=Marinobacter sp. DUT-1 TaxID=3412037 RepID=UPI003D180DE9
MNAENVTVTSIGREALDFSGRGSLLRTVSRVIVIAASLIAGASVVYATGGTGYAYPYTVLLPVILTAAWFGPVPTVISAVIAGLLLGPYMPMDVEKGLIQSTDNWLARTAFFMLIGGFSSWLFQSLRISTQRHFRDIKIDRETGLPNQVALKEDLVSVLSSATSRKAFSGSPGVILVRLQDLWEIMEAMGPQTANKVVCCLADRVSVAVSCDHKIYRFSTSELLLLFFASSQEEVDNVAKSVRSAGEQEAEIDGIPLRVQLIVGSYLVERNVVEPDLVVNRARTALFAAVDANAFYRSYDPIFDHKTVEQVRLISGVRKGLRENEFCLFYQPKVCLRSGRHTGGEALLRWFKSDGSVVLPGLFMPKLETTTLIDPVTRFVIRKACEDVKQHDLCAVSINFSAKNLMDTALVQNLGRVVSLCGVEPGKLEIEITERALIRDPANAKLAIESLRNQGFLVSLDDFGTGYSSFQYLAHLPLSGLKIDRAFVSSVHESPHARTVLSSMIKMAHALNLHVTVEGVETREQHEIVAEYGADTAQGFYYAKPMPLTEYVNWKCGLNVDARGGSTS